MYDQKLDKDVAVKQMPNWWVLDNHEAFRAQHPNESEMPWQDIGCTHFLNTVGFEDVCTLHGVFRGASYTYVATAFATEGDLFGWCQGGAKPGPERELAVA